MPSTDSRPPSLLPGLALAAALEAGAIVSVAAFIFTLMVWLPSIAGQP